MAATHSSNAPERLKTLLNDLRDSPRINVDDVSLSYIFDCVMARQPGSDGHHWYCHRVDELHVMASTFLIRLFAFDGQKKDRWISRLKEVLSNCCDCIRGFQKGKWLSRQTYLARFDTRDIDQFIAVVNDWEQQLVIDSLSQAGFHLDQASPPNNHLTLLDARIATSYHIFSNINVLRNPAVSSLVLTHTPSEVIRGWPPDPPPPGLFLLLFHKEARTRSFATSQLSVSRKVPMSEDELTGAYHDVLKIISRVTSFPSELTNPNGLPNTPNDDSGVSVEGLPFPCDQRTVWVGCRIAIRHIPDRFLRSGIQGLPDVSHIVVGELHNKGPQFEDILKCLAYMVKRQRSDFWTGRGDDYPNIVFSSIKDNPSFSQLVQSTNSFEQPPWYLVWLLDFISSLRRSRAFGDVLANVIDFLVEELQHERFQDSRPLSMGVASKVLLSALKESRDPEPSIAIKHSVYDVLHIHIDRFSSVAFSRSLDSIKWSLPRGVTRSLIYHILELDVQSVLKSTLDLSAASRACKAAKSTSVSSPVSVPAVHPILWRKVYERVEVTDPEAITMILCSVFPINHLDLLMKSAYRRVFDLLPPARNAFDETNQALSAIREGFSRSITQFSNRNSTASVQQILLREGVVEKVIALMLGPVEDIRDAGQSLVGQAYDVDLREDCFRSLLEHFPERSFKGIFTFLETFITYVPSCAEACMLSASLVTCLNDIINVLCGSPDSLLFDRTFLDGNKSFKPSSMLQPFWNLMTRAIAVIFQYTPAWSIFVNDHKWMLTWMRDALILGRTMLDKWRKIEEAAVATAGQPDFSPRKLSRIGRKMVDDLQIVLPELARWLRLTDQELLHQAYSLLQSLFSCFEETGVPPKAESIAKLQRDVERLQKQATFTKLDGNRIKMLQETITAFGGSGDDEIEIVSAPPLKQSKLGRHFRDNKASGPSTSGHGLRPTGRTQASMKDFIQSQPARSVETSLTTQRPQKLAQPQRLQARQLPPTESKRIAVREQEKIEVVSPPQPRPLKPTRPTTKSGSEKLDSSDASAESSSESDRESDGGLATLHTFQKEKKPERRTKLLSTVPGIVTQRRSQNTARDEARRARLRMKPDVSDLHRAILSWPFEHEGDIPPGPSLSLTPVVDRYSDYWHFRKTFEPLLILECWAQLVKAKQDQQDAYECEITSRQYVDQWLDLDIYLPEHFAPGWALLETDVVLMRNPRSDKTILAKTQMFKPLRGNRTGVQATLRCHLAGRPDPGLAPSSRWLISKAFSLSTVHREYAALIALEFYDDRDFILNPRLPFPAEVSKAELEKTTEKFNLNEPQARAILSSIQSNSRFTLIQGPPGTGKTSTICGLIQTFISSRASAPTAIATSSTRSTSDPISKKILVCAPSNAAIDEVASRIKDAGRTTIKVIRIGAEKSLNASTKDISLESIVEERLAGDSGTKDRSDEYARLSAALASVRQALKEKETEVSIIIDNTVKAKLLDDERQALIDQRRELSRKLNTLKDDNMKAGRSMDSDRRKLRMAVLAESDVICCTLSGSGHDVIEALEFEMIVIDEAAQAIELSTLIPLRFNCAKCIMVGDPQQLPPTVLSKEATKFRYNQSLFVRLQKQRPEAVHLLSIQYRMHPEISLLPSQLFYQGRLKDGPGMAERTKRVWQDNPRFGIYRFFNVIGSQEVSVGFSTTNPTEVQIAVQLFARLTKEYPSINFESRVGFITPYREQLKALRLAFRKRFGEEIVSSVDFNTVDGFQGQEKDIIVLSCVRAGPSLESIGFLRDERRMNVALTRAKCSLFVLGHAATLERSDENWRSLIQDARKRSLLTDVNNSFFTTAGALVPARSVAPAIPPAHESLPVRPPKPIEQAAPASPTKLMTPSEMRSKATPSSINGLASRQLDPTPSLSVTGAIPVLSKLKPEEGSEVGKKRPHTSDEPLSSAVPRPKPKGPPPKKQKQTSMFLPKKKPSAR